MIDGFTPALKSRASTAFGQFDPKFSQDFLGTFIESPKASIEREAVIKQARISKERVIDPFVNYQLDSLTNKLAHTPPLAC